MGWWLSENFQAVLFGLGMGGMVIGWFDPSIWWSGALAGVGLAVPLWQIVRD